MNRKRFHIILIPHTDAAIRDIRIPYFLLTTLLILGLVGGGVFAFLVYHYINYTIDSVTLLQLKSINTAMAARLESIDKDLFEIRDEMKQLAEFDEQMRQLADMEQIDPDVRSVGIGGPVVEADPVLQDLEPEARQLVEKVTLRTDELIRQTRFQKQSYIDIIETINENKGKFDHTPSIAPIDFPPLGFRWTSNYPGWCSSTFDWRIDPFTGERRFHEGIDISARAGTPIRAPAHGKVILLRRGNPFFGNIIRIDHGNGIVTTYGHLANFNVKQGQSVKRWDIIGYVGNTGRATGTHVHYSVYKNRQPQNPMKYILPQARLGAFNQP